MIIRLVDRDWKRELTQALRADTTSLRIVCPFIKLGTLDRLLSIGPRAIQVITRFDLSDFSIGVSDIAALRKLMDAGASVRGVRNLHAKLYLFGTSRAIVTSANLTDAALNRNHEFGMVSEDAAVIAACNSYFDDLWARAGSDLVPTQTDTWDEEVTRYRAAGTKSKRLEDLGDFGVDAGIPELAQPNLPVAVADAFQAFVKFLGEGDNRVPLSFSTIAEIDRAGCHWAVGYPRNKRPRNVKDGAVMFFGRLTSDPNDIRVFGRAIGLSYVPGRDDATPDDIALRDWKKKWPRYIRVHQAEFVAGTMANGVSLNELMSALGSDSFATTQRNAAGGDRNTNPRKAYLQQPAVKLSAEGLVWLSEHLQAAFETHGTVPQDTLDQFGWPKIP